MVWLNILNNETFLLIAETLFIVVGSMLLGILLYSINAGGLKSKMADLILALEEEKKQTAELRDQVSQISQVRAELQQSIEQLTIKSSEQSRTIYEQQQYLQVREAEYKNQKGSIDGLHTTIDSYQHRLDIIQEELEKAKAGEPKPRKSTGIPTVHVNFDHVSKLLGRQVTENDLTLIVGIGPKTAALLQSKGIQTWDELAAMPIDDLRQILMVAGGVYKSQDPTHWAKQAVMASQGEWRKLRVFQEAIRKEE